MQVRNASPEDINRSSLGRMVGGIALLWLASYAIGIPFKYGLAGAALAVSAVLFAEWDHGSRTRRARNSRTNLTVRLALCSLKSLSKVCRWRCSSEVLLVFYWLSLLSLHQVGPGLSRMKVACIWR